MSAVPAVAQSGIPENLGGGLRELVEAHRAGQLTGMNLRKSRLVLNPQTRRRALAYGGQAHMMVDAQNRVMVRMVLDGAVPMSDLRRTLRTLGVSIAAEDSSWRNGILEGHIPLEQAETIAQLQGVAAVNLLHAPVSHTGSVTSQGAEFMHSDQVNKPGVVAPNGITGRGITIGILSDSFNLSGELPSAFDDVKSGDLPNLGVPDGRPGMKFLIDSGDGFPDEGRAVAQVAYDIAPGASLCFATAGLGPLSFANNIRRLRTDSQCAADILVDDISYLDEPVFSDGPIGLAVNDVVSSPTLAGKPVAYFAASGNGAGAMYSSDLRIVSDADARALADQNVDLSTIPTRIDTSGGFHNFNPDPNGPPAITQLATISLAFSSDQSVFVLQWDDPFDVKDGITTDLNLLVFDSSGKYLFSSAANNFSTLEPIEAVGLSGSFKVRLVIARTGRGSQAAKKVAWVALTSGVLSADFVDSTGPSIFGHAGTKGAIAVGAYWYDNGLNTTQFTPELESFSSGGPVTICCDSAGNRLDALEVRQKPEICAVDGVSNTFFGDPDFTDTFFTFFGTSASAPHAAGVAALMLEAAGGPRSLTSDQIRSRLIASTGPHDLDLNFSQAVLGDNNMSVKLKAQGAEDFTGLTNTKFFTLEYTSSNASQTLESLAIDLGSTGIFFNTNNRTGFAFKASQMPDGVQVSSSVSGNTSTVLTLTFTGLKPGGVVQFGIGRAQRSTRSDGLSADLLGGAAVTATLAGPAGTLNGSFVNEVGTGYRPQDGYGLIDAMKAVKAQ